MSDLKGATPLKVEDSSISCGVDLIFDIGPRFTYDDLRLSIEGIKDKKSSTSPFYSYFYDHDCGWIEEPVLHRGMIYIFSDALECGNGERLASIIRRHKLGPIISTRAAKNPNSGRKIKVWVWRYNGRKLPKKDIPRRSEK